MPRDQRGRMVLALGESTGHAHAGWQRPLYPAASAFAPMHLCLPEGGRVVHDEHAAFTLPSGWYRVVSDASTNPARCGWWPADADLNETAIAEETPAPLEDWSRVADRVGAVDRPRVRERRGVLDQEPDRRLGLVLAVARSRSRSAPPAVDSLQKGLEERFEPAVPICGVIRAKESVWCTLSAARRPRRARRPATADRHPPENRPRAARRTPLDYSSSVITVATFYHPPPTIAAARAG